MNLPNKITISRIFLIPLIMIFLLVPFQMGDFYFLGTTLPLAHFIAALIFIVASATDWVDGYFARKLNLITDFGKFLDPLADKLLITAALISLVELDLVFAWMAIVIISREFAVTGLRLVAATGGKVIAASNLGKLKTVSQIVAIASIMLHNWPFQMLSFPFHTIAIWVAVILTIWSGIDYFLKNKHIFMNSK